MAPSLNWERANRKDRVRKQGSVPVWDDRDKSKRRNRRQRINCKAPGCNKKVKGAAYCTRHQWSRRHKRGVIQGLSRDQRKANKVASRVPAMTSRRMLASPGSTTVAAALAADANLPPWAGGEPPVLSVRAALVYCGLDQHHPPLRANLRSWARSGRNRSSRAGTYDRARHGFTLEQIAEWARWFNSRSVLGKS